MYVWVSVHVLLCLCQWSDSLVDKFSVLQTRELQTRRQFDECIGQFHAAVLIICIFAATILKKLTSGTQTNLQ